MNQGRLSGEGLSAGLRTLPTRLRSSIFVRNAAWFTGISGVQRAAGLVQTILIARVLGITEYGAYGLLNVSIGFMASVMGLQMGLTATVFVARYRDNNKANAGAVIRHVMHFALAISAVFLVCTVPFADKLSAWLLKSDQYAIALLVGCLFVPASILSGVQDGIAEGFEDFRAVAITRLIGVVVSLVAIYPAAVHFGLTGVLVTLVAGVAIKYVLLAAVVARHKRRQAIPRHGGAITFVDLVKNFALPSMLVSLLLGTVLWFGTYLLSRQAAGFAAVAIVSVGLQWRGPIILVADALGRVAVPVFSRRHGAGDVAGSQRFKRQLMWLNGVAVVLVVAALITCGKFILSFYGDDFQGGWLVFSLILAAVIPKVLADVHMQKVIGEGRMWLQLLVYLPMLVLAAGGFLWLVPHFGGLGYAMASLAAFATLWVCALIASRHDHLKSSRP